MRSVNNGWEQAEKYLEKGMEEGLIREVSIPVVMAMVKGTVICFMESDVLYQNELTYEQAKKEMVEILMKGIKEIVRRTRPSWKWIKEGGFSYPSGHTISAVLLYGTLLLIVKKHVHGKSRKPLIIFLSCMMFLIPISRIYFGVHYLTDVLASTILGIIILIITNMIMDKEYYIHDKNKDRKTI